MRIIQEGNSCDLQKGTYIALGSFDGLHKGHLSLVQKIKELSKKNNGLSTLFTFTKHPLEEICPDKAPKLVIDNDYKFRILKQQQVDLVIMRDFDNDFMKKTPEEFVKMLVEEYNAKGIVVGFNYRFGYKNQGDTNLLIELSKKYGYEVAVMTPCTYTDEVISSTRIRNSILNGNVTDARKMLTRPYSLEGEVVHGKKLGRTIGFPTANMEVSKKMVIPQNGVYYTNVLYNNNIYKAITNVGNNPTVNGQKLTIEPYILDFDKDIYGEKIRVYFLERIRDEKKFESLDALVNQLKMDAEYALNRELITQTNKLD
ncbi:MAG: bifunctional riboflavin kinase/FAD synthetase [Clostridium sp.]